MAKHCRKVSLLKICALIIISAFVKTKASDDGCFLDFKSYETALYAYNACGKVFLDKLNWNGATAACLINFSYLAYRVDLGTLLYKDLKNASVDLMWVGIRRKANFFVSNSSDLFEEEESSWGYKWSAGEPRINDCVALNVSDGTLRTHSCEDRLPFACENIGAAFVYNASISEISCPENWTLSLPLASLGRKCVSSVQQARSLNDSQGFCGNNGGRLATQQEYVVLRQHDYFPESPEAYWIKKEEGGPCTFTVIANGLRLERPENCSMPLQFICVRDFEINNMAVEVGIFNDDVHREVFPKPYSCHTMDSLTCTIVNITDKNFKLMPIFRWYINGIPVNQCTTSSCSTSFRNTLLKWNLYNSTEGSNQGSYHCEVSLSGLTKTYRSPKIEIFYSDLATYTIDIRGIGINSFVDYSQTKKFEKSMENMDGIISSLFESEIFYNLDPTWDLQSISVNKSATMKLLVFVNRTRISGFDDVEMYNKIKKLFEDNASKFAYNGNISVVVNSADVCFSEKVKESDTCNKNPYWPTSIQGKKILPTSICFDEHRKPLFRECKSNSVSKAKWSDFSCSACKNESNNVKERFQDFPFRCPEGYSKLRKRNVCFKVAPEKKNWYDAHKICADNSSYLLNEPYEEIGLRDFWLSYKYSHGQIQDVGMKPLNLKLENIVAGNPEFRCISVTEENYAYKLKLENCSKEISFACIQNPYELLSSVRFANTWIKENSQKACYYFDQDVRNFQSWNVSRDQCKRTFDGAVLLNGIQDIDTYSHLRKIIHNAFDDEITCKKFSWWSNFTHEAGFVSNITFVDWSPSVNFKTLHPRGSITLYPDKSIYWTLHDEAISYLKVACEISNCKDDRPVQAYIEDSTEPEVIKLKCVPSGWFVANSMQWYKDGIILNALSRELSITSSSATSGASETIHELKKQGYYSCSVDQYMPIHTVHSSEYLFKIPGFHTFVLSMVSKNMSYVTDCSKYMLRLISLDDVSLKDCFSRNFDGKLENSYFLLKNLTCNSTHVDITVHVYCRHEWKEEQLLKEIHAKFPDLFNNCDIDPSISLRSADVCYKVVREMKNFNVTWPTTSIGKIAYPEEMCLTDNGAFLSRRCLGDFNTGAKWSDITVDECSGIASDETKELSQLKSEVYEGTYESLCDLPNIMPPEELKPVDLQIFVQIFEKLADEKSLSIEKLNVTVHSINTLIDAKPEVFILAENSSNQIIEFFDFISSNTDTGSKNVRINTKNIFVDIYPLNQTRDNVPNCIILSNNGTEYLNNASPKNLGEKIQDKDLDAGIVLPLRIINESSSDRLVYAVYKNFHHLKNTKVLSLVIHAYLPNMHMYDLGNDEVTLFFKLNEKIDITANKTPKCVFWDHYLSNWSYKGCFLKEMHENSVLCICNHLTSFSVIMEEEVVFGT